MKLNPQFLYQTIGGEGVLVPVGQAGQDFHGIVRLNGTASFLVDCLRRDTTREELIAALEEKYEGDREKFSADVENALTTLREIGALIE